MDSLWLGIIQVVFGKGAFTSISRRGTSYAKSAKMFWTTSIWSIWTRAAQIPGGSFNFLSWWECISISKLLFSCFYYSFLLGWWNGRHWGLKIPSVNSGCRFDSCSEQSHCEGKQAKVTACVREKWSTIECELAGTGLLLTSNSL